MVAELQLQRVGVEIDLLFQVGFVVLPDVVVDKRHRNDQGDKFPAVLVDEIDEFPLLAGGDVLPCLFQSRYYFTF